MLVIGVGIHHVVLVTYKNHPLENICVKAQNYESMEGKIIQQKLETKRRQVYKRRPYSDGSEKDRQVYRRR